MLCSSRSKRYLILLFIILFATTAIAMTYKNITSLNINLNIINDEMVVSLSRSDIYVRSVSFRDPNLYTTIFKQEVARNTNNFIIKDYKKSLIEEKPYYFVIFLEDPKKPSKLFDGVTFCYKNSKVIQTNEDSHLQDFEKLCQNL